MESYFTVKENILKRFFFVFGLTKDRFCENNHVPVDMDHLLYKHLKDIGYKRIIFYSLDETLYFYDKASFESTKEPNEVPKEKIINKPAVKSKRLKGPISGRFKSTEKKSDDNQSMMQPEDPSEENCSKLHFGVMTTKGAFDRIDYCIRDEKKTKIKTAVVFTNAEDFNKYFKEDQERKLSDSFNKFDDLNADNKNIVIFVFPEGNQCDFIDKEKDKDSFFVRKITEKNTINISNPSLEEIRNLINYYRLKCELKVNFKNLDTICKRIAREYCKEHRSLKLLQSDFIEIVEDGDILDIERCDKMFPNSNNETAMQKLNSLTGMESVKREIRQLENRNKSNELSVKNEKYHSRILPPVIKEEAVYNLNYIITGNPGTGKTTAARLLGEIMYEAGYLDGGHTVEATRKDLVKGYVGQTAIQTAQKIEEAMGGVLFIDEAYSLVQGGENDFGPEAITELVAAMTARKGQFSLVVAGYPDLMKKFMDSNPGLERRFKKIIHIEDYEPEELLKIFYAILLKNEMKEKYTVSDELSGRLNSFFENWFKTRDKDWGNAGNVEKLLQNMSGNWYERSGERTKDGKIILDVCDIPNDLKKFDKPSEQAKEEAIVRLKKLTGLASVKEQIEKLKRRIKVKGTSEPGHYVFSGNPGTGKTTVARLLGDIFREEGVLRRGHVVEVLREDLVGEHVGETAPKTKKKLEEALDGIFFLDEAYSLVQGGKNDFGTEAINTILPFMENNRERICVIIAGYTKNMEEFMQSNAGLARRFPNIIVFEDYNTNELVEILRNFAKGFILEQDFINKSMHVFDFWIANKTSSFGNAGQVRNYFAESEDALYERISIEYEDDIPEEAKKTLTGKDIPSKYLSIIGK